jgi:conjugal transfer pilus assembly protein TrbC
MSLANKQEAYFNEKGCKNDYRTESNKLRNCRPSGMTPLNRASSTLVVVFVSFSMPDASLKELGENADKYGATLVLRGLHEGSFVKTKEKILAINKNGIPLEINPELFRRYNIYRVPTFVLLKDGKEVHRLSGNVTLEYAAAKLRKK